MKISHESPLCLLEESRLYNDYDYALVHLFEEIPEYYEFFVESLKRGRHVLLDNSIFELGVSFDPVKYTDWIVRLQPTEYIIPDVLEDTLGTMDSALDWKENQMQLLKMEAPYTKCIGVVQGRTYEELIQCYHYMDDVIGVDKIAISFDYSYYQKVFPHPNKWMSYALGRAYTLTQLNKDGVINKFKPHHLLGCALPIEFMFYQDFDWVETIDTSNPIVHGLLGIKYAPGGLTDKQTIKLADMMHYPYPDIMKHDTIRHNVNSFRQFANGNK